MCSSDLYMLAMQLQRAGRRQVHYITYIYWSACTQWGAASRACVLRQITFNDLLMTRPAGNFVLAYSVGRAY